MSYDPGAVRADAKFQMGNGTYPISTCADVSDAAKLAHHSKTYSFAQVKAHVMKAKNALSCPDSVLPSTWAEQQQEKSARPPRDSLIRGVFPLEFRAEDEGGDVLPVLTGHFAVFDQWTEINSAWEGRFMESVAPGAGAKTMQENRANVRVLFNHGQDASMGNMVMGSIRDLREDDQGGYYAVPLFRGIPELIMEGLGAGQYGASFRFTVMKENWNDRAEQSDWNPDGLPERRILEYRLAEFGPVTFAAYKGATAGIRSLTDDFIVRQLVGDPERLQSLLSQHIPSVSSALSRPGAEPAHSAAGEPQSSRWPQVSREEFIGTSRSGRASFDP